MGYELLKTVHLLAIVAWVGGMFFTLVCLRPAAMLLDAPQRVRLMHATLARFFKVVLAAAALVLASGVWMIGRVAKATVQSGGQFNMPLDWWAMVVLGVLMVLIFGHIRFVLFKRLDRAVAAQDWPQGGQALGSIRSWVMVNLWLGVIIIVVLRLGAVS
jgi:uncharacterized membrane protein